MDLVKWEQLWNFWKNVQETKSTILLDQEENIQILVLSCKREMSGCGGCKTRYECFYLSGYVCADYLEDDPLEFSAEISQYHMHRCPNDTSIPIEWLPLFKGYIEETKHCVLHRFIDDDKYLVK